ncbi:MAG: uroporphyrinogen-III C-methyltransferase [Candidatus Omnitrophota bacterium]
MMKGKVYLVGAGPGKPDLITVRGQNILREADVIIYDYLVDGRILGNAKENAELVNCAGVENSKNKSGSGLRQEIINKLLVKKAKEGKRVVRLKGGDPAIFGRCFDELEALVREKIEFELVPGITAASAASLFSGVPLTDRRFSSSCVFVAGQEDPAKEKSSIDWDSVSKIDTVVFYMGMGTLEKIVEQLKKAGKDKSTPVAVIQEASRSNQKVLIASLNDIAEKAKKKGFKPPAIIIIGETVRLEKRVNCLKKNKRILFTGLSAERYFLKGTYEHVPFIKIQPANDYKKFDMHVKNIEDFDWIVFTSRYGVKYFFDRLRKIQLDARKLCRVKIAVIGKSTQKKLSEYFLEADLIPREESSTGLIKAFRKIDLKDKKVFIPRSNISDKGMTKTLKTLGANVTASVAYRNVMPDDLPELDLNDFDEIMFTSPSTVRNFKEKYKKIPKKIKVSYIGDVTLEEAERCQLTRRID